jgi:hypothetical protein
MLRQEERLPQASCRTVYDILPGVLSKFRYYFFITKSSPASAENVKPIDGLDKICRLSMSYRDDLQAAGITR